MLDLDRTLDPQTLSRMMTLQAAYLREAGLLREAEALCARAEVFDGFAATMQALRSAPIRDEAAAIPMASATVVRLADRCAEADPR